MNGRHGMARNDKGLSLLEVLVAVSVLGIAVVMLFQLFASGMRSLFTSEDYVRAVMKGEEKMRLLLDDPELRESSWSEAGADGYVMKISVTELEKEKTAGLKMELLQVDLKIEWKTGRGERSFALSTIKDTGAIRESGGTHGI